MIDLCANRIKQKDKRRVEVDESKEVKGPDWQNADCTDAKEWQALELDLALKNATPLFKTYKLPTYKRIDMHKSSTCLMNVLITGLYRYVYGCSCLVFCIK